MTDRPRSSEGSFFRHCPRCAGPLSRVREEGRVRPACVDCGYVQYRNPIVGVAAVIEEDEVRLKLGVDAVREGTEDSPASSGRRILMARRCATYAGLYCIPCGYVEYDEEIREAVVREVEEETGLLIEPLDVLAVLSNFHEPDNQSIGVWFRTRVLGGSLSPGDDVDRLRFVSPADPQVPLAFPTDAEVLAFLTRERESDSASSR